MEKETVIFNFFFWPLIISSGKSNIKLCLVKQSKKKGGGGREFPLWNERLPEGVLSGHVQKGGSNVWWWEEDPKDTCQQSPRHRALASLSPSDCPCIFTWTIKELAPGPGAGSKILFTILHCVCDCTMPVPHPKGNPKTKSKAWWEQSSLSPGSATQLTGEGWKLSKNGEASKQASWLVRRQILKNSLNGVLSENFQWKPDSKSLWFYGHEVSGMMT